MLKLLRTFVLKIEKRYFMVRGMVKIEQPNKKDAVLKAAIEIFSKKGYPSATIREIGTKAGVSTGTIYFYFKNKAEILKEIFKRMDQIPIESFIESKGILSEAKAFEEICRYSLEFLARDFKLFMLFINESTNSTRLSDFFFNEFSKGITDLAKLFGKYSENGIFRDLNHKGTALCTIAMTTALVMFKEGPFKRQLKDIQYEDLVKMLTEIFLNGLLTEKAKMAKIETDLSN